MGGFGRAKSVFHKVRNGPDFSAAPTEGYGVRAVEPASIAGTFVPWCVRINSVVGERLPVRRKASSVLS